MDAEVSHGSAAFFLSQGSQSCSIKLQCCTRFLSEEA